MNGSKRTISRILAFVMLVSAMFTNVIAAGTDVNDVSLTDDVISSASAVVDDTAAEDASSESEDVIVEDVKDIPVEDLFAVDHFDWVPEAEVADKGIIHEDENVKIVAEQALALEHADSEIPFYGEVKAIDRIKAGSVKTRINGTDYRFALSIEAKTDVNVSLATMLGGGKTIAYVRDVNLDAGTGTVNANETLVGDAENVTYPVYQMFPIDLKAGDKVYFGGIGTGAEIYGINISPLTISEDAKSTAFWFDDFASAADESGKRTIKGGSEFTQDGSTIKFLPGLKGEDWDNVAKSDFTHANFSSVGGREDAGAYKAGGRPDNIDGVTKTPGSVAVPESGSAILFTPGASGIINVYYKTQKYFTFVDYVGGVLQSFTNVPNLNAASRIEAKATFKVVAGHQYIITPNTSTNDYATAGIEFVMDSPVDVPIKWTNDGKGTYDNVNIIFNDKGTGEENVATVKYGSPTASLMDGHEYVITTDDLSVKAEFGTADATVESFIVKGDTANIYLSALPNVQLTGSIVADNPEDVAKVTGLTFTNMKNAELTGEAVITDGKYTVTLKPGEYKATVTSEGDAVSTKDRASVKAEGENTDDVYVVPTAAPVYPSEFKADLNVPGDYDTLTEANAAIKAMTRPSGEEGRVTIHLTDDIREQVVFDAPYITVDGSKSDGGKYEISWYYGQTGEYYSIDGTSGLFDKELFMDKYEKTAASTSLWGGVAIIRGNNFKTVNTIYRNTFNYEVTPEELEDGAVSVAFASGRKADSNVSAYAAKERSNAFYIEAANIEAVNCEILSTQDTLGRNGTTHAGEYSAYFKDCVIGGNTDYICGLFSAVFDNCELRWFAYKDDPANNAKVGYIAVPKQDPYVFRNCYVTTDGKEGTDAEGNPVPVTGCWGRTWGENSNVTFLNCVTNDHILENAWGQMNPGDSETAYFKEVGSTTDGTTPFETTNDFNIDTKLTDEALIEKLEGDGVLDVVYGDGEAGSGWLPDAYESTAKWGDVNDDNNVDAIDVSVTLQYTLTPSLDKVPDPFYPARADVTGDDKVNSADVAAILQKVLNSTYELPVEKNNVPVPPAEPAEKEDLPATTVWVVGDSTACHYTEIEDPLYWFKRVGFGDKLQQYLDPQATVENLALSGRSSKSFATGINENGVTDQAAVDNYNRLKSEIKEGDYLIIAWGHNDEKTDAYRQTVPAATPGDYTQEGSFEKSLYDNYIKIAQDASATPILCTPIIRANASGTLSNNDLHKPAAGDYSVPIKALGEKLGILVVDSLANTESLYTRLGAGADAKTNEEAKLPDVPTGYMTLHAALQDKAADTTHLNAFGASMVAYMMAKDIRSGSTGLEKYIGRIQEPTFNNDECKNPDWEAFDESIYNPSSIWKFGADSKWAGSVFGSSVGTFTEDNHPNCDIVLNADQSVTLMAANNKGKIASDRDGITMYFQEIDANQPFTLTATAHIDEITDTAKKGTQEYDAGNNQAGFGLMLRDNMFTDYNYDTNAHYFAVGSTAQSSGSADVSVWRRKTMPDGSAKNMEQTVVKAYNTSAEAKAAIPAGSSFDLKISRDANGVVTLQRGTEEPVVFDATTGADTNLKAVKADKDYVGMFVARKGTVTFSNIKLELQ